MSYVRPIPRVIVKYNGTRIHHVRGNLKLARNKPIEWGITMDYAAGNYGPSSSVADSARTRSPHWSIEIHVAGEVFRFTNLVAEQYGVSAESGEITIHGICLAHRLQNAGFMGDVDGLESRDVIQEICAHYGVACSVSHSEMLDYFHRARGAPISWINNLTYPLADWSVENGTLTVRPVEYGMSPRWGFTDREQLEVLDYQATPWAIRNRAIVDKVSAGGDSLLLEVERQATDFRLDNFFGPQPPAQLPYPARNLRCRTVYATRGSLREFVFDGAAGPASSTESAGGIYAGSIPILQVRFNYWYGDDAFAGGENELWVPGYRLRIYGESAERAQKTSPPVEAGPWTGLVAVPDGIVQSYEEPFTVGHWTAAVGQKLADAYAYEGALRAETVRWETQIAPWVRPGYNVRLTERRRTGYNGKHVFVQDLEHTWDNTVDEDGRIADSGTTVFNGSALLSA